MVCPYPPLILTVSRQGVPPAHRVVSSSTLRISYGFAEILYPFDSVGGLCRKFAGRSKKSAFFVIFLLFFVWKSVKILSCLPAGKLEDAGSLPLSLWGATDLAENRTNRASRPSLSISRYTPNINTCPPMAESVRKGPIHAQAF